MTEATQGSTFVFPTQERSCGSNDCAAIMSMLAAMQARPNMDMATAMSLAKDKGVTGSDFIIVLFLFAMFGGFGGGFGFGGRNIANNDADTMRLSNFISNGDNFNKVLNAIQGNGNDIRDLSQALNCSTGQITSAINSVQNQICTSGLQLSNLIQSGNNNITSTMQSGFCSLGNKIQEQGYQNQLANCSQTNSITNAINASAQTMIDNTNAHHQEILAKLNDMEKTALQSKIESLQETKSSLESKLAIEHQTREVQTSQAQMLQPIVSTINSIQQELSAIKSSQPPTATIPYSPVVGVPAAVAYQAGLNGANGGGFWY